MLQLAAASMSKFGPSPRIRGEYSLIIKRTLPTRTIPANTGRIGGESDWVHVDRDHPREYGENSRHERLIDVPIGPSPRIRGELEPADSCVHGIGTIPANTGRISGDGHVPLCGRDHPREYGENGWARHPEHLHVGTIPANTGRIQHA